MSYTPDQLEADVGFLTSLPQWQDETKRPEFIREVATKARTEADPDTHRQLVGELWNRAQGGMVQRGVDFVQRSAGEVLKSIPAAPAAGMLALSDAVGATNSGSGTRLERGLVDTADAAAQRLKRSPISLMLPQTGVFGMLADKVLPDAQAARDQTIDALRRDLDAGAHPPGLERWLSGDDAPDAETKPWVDALTRGIATRAVAADHGGKPDPQKITEWLQSDRNPAFLDSDTPGVPGPRALLADYLVTRDPTSWEAFKARVTETDSQRTTRLRRFAAEAPEFTATVAAAPKDSLAQEMMTRSADMQTSPLDLATAALPALRSVRILKAATAGAQGQGLLRRGLDDAAREFGQEAGTEMLSNPNASTSQILEAGAMGGVGQAAVSAPSAVAGTVLNRLQSPSASVTDRTATPPANQTVPDAFGGAGSTPAAGAPSPSPLGGIARRAGTVDVAPLVPGLEEDTGALTAQDVQDLERGRGGDTETIRQGDNQTGRQAILTNVPDAVTQPDNGPAQTITGSNVQTGTDASSEATRRMEMPVPPPTADAGAGAGATVPDAQGVGQELSDASQVSPSPSLPVSESPAPLMLPSRNFTGGLAQQLEGSAATLGRNAARGTRNPEPITTNSSLSSAYAQAARGSSSAMVPISRVYEQAKAQNAALTVPQFLADVQAADQRGEVLLEPFDSPAGLQAAGEFVVRNASGVPSVNMAVPSPQGMTNEEGRRTNGLRNPAERGSGAVMASQSGAAQNAEPSPGGLSEAEMVGKLLADKIGVMRSDASRYDPPSELWQRPRFQNRAIRVAKLPGRDALRAYFADKTTLDFEPPTRSDGKPLFDVSSYNADGGFRAAVMSESPQTRWKNSVITRTLTNDRTAYAEFVGFVWPASTGYMMQPLFAASLAKEKMIDDLLGLAQANQWPYGIHENPISGAERDVIYIDTPAGQLSFHDSSRRGQMPPYQGRWDGLTGATAFRLHQLFNDEAAKVSQGGFQKQESAEASAFGGNVAGINADESPAPVNPESSRAEGGTLASPAELKAAQAANESKLSALGLPVKPGTRIWAAAKMRTALGKIAKDGSYPATMRAMADLLTRVNLDNLLLKVEADARLNFAGKYQPYNDGRGEISLNTRVTGRGDTDIVQSLVHELLHHATYRALRSPKNATQKGAIADLEALRKRALAALSAQEQGRQFDYELSNTDEFIAALFTRADFQTALAGIPADSAPKSLSQRIRSVLDEIFRVLGELVTGKKVEPGSVLEASFSATLRLMENGRLSVQARIGNAVMTQGPGPVTIRAAALLAVKAYHGTPHKVDRFSTSKIDTGEGAQAYGWGLYFAESKSVAESYKEAGVDIRLRGLSPESKAFLGVEEPNLYTVELLPDEDEFLDWDKPLAEQSEKVRAALSNAPQIIKDFAQRVEMEGGAASSVYNFASHAGRRGDVSMEAASQLFSSLGIPGIKYLDGGSRAKGDGSRNFVVFDEKHIRITEENGQPVEGWQTAPVGGMTNGEGRMTNEAALLNPAEGPPMLENRSRMALSEQEQRMYEAQTNAGMLAEAEQWLAGVDNETAVRQIETGLPPAGLRSDHLPALTERTLQRLAAAATRTNEIERLQASALLDRAFTAHQDIINRRAGTALQQVGAANDRLALIMPIMGAKKTLIDRAEAVVKNRFKGGADGVVERLNAILGQSGTEASSQIAQAVQGTLDLAPPVDATVARAATNAVTQAAKTYFGGTLPARVKIVHQERADWDARMNGSVLELNAAALEASQVAGKIEHEIGHLLFQDPAMRQYFDTLWNSLDVNERAQIENITAVLYDAVDRNEESSVRALDAVRQIVEAKNPSLWQRFVTWLKQAWERLTGRMPRDPRRLAAVMIETGVARLKGADGHVAGIRESKRSDALKVRSPQLAKMLNNLRRKMYPGMDWTEIFTDLPSTQKQRQLAIYQRLMQDERLQGLTAQERLDLTNELDKAWQRERREVFKRELRKAGILGEKDAGDRLKVTNAMPKLLRLVNLGMFNSAMFREVIAPQYGLKVIDSTTAARLRGMAEAAYAQPEGVLRNRKLGELLNAMQSATGSTLAELVNSYWTAAVLSGTRTQWDTWMAFTNGMGTNLLQAAGLLARGRGKEAVAAHAAWWRGLLDGMRESLQILAKGDYSVLKRFGTDLNKALQGESGFRPVPLGESLWQNGNTWQKYFMAPVMIWTGRLMAAADHVNNTATTAGAMAVARALHPEFYGRTTFSETDRANARAQALREVTGGAEPVTAADKATVSVRVRELLYGAMREPERLEANEIGDMAAFQNDPTGIFGTIYAAMKAGLGTVQRGMEDYAQDMQASQWTRAAAGLMAGSLHGLTGTRFMRFGFNFGAELTRYVPGTALLDKTFKGAVYGRDAGPMQRELLLGKNVIGLMLGSKLAALFLNSDDDDEGWQIEGDWSGLTPQQVKERMSAGLELMTMWKRDGDTVRRVSYKQWPTMGLFAVVGGMLDEKRHKPAQFAQHGTAGHLGRALGTGMLQIKNVSAMRNLVELFGGTRFAGDPSTGIIDDVVKTATNFAGGFVPTALKDAEIWQDPRNFKAEGWLEELQRSTPIARRFVNDGRPQLNLLGEEVKLQRAPWSRTITSVESSEASRVLGALLGRGLNLPQPSDAVLVVQNGVKVPLETLGREKVWQYEKAVGTAYKQWLATEGSALLQMPVKQAAKVIEQRAASIKRQALARVVR